MDQATEKEIGAKYYPRFGQLAVDRGFVTAEQLREALTEQMANDPVHRLRPHQLIGEIFFEKGWMTFDQVSLIVDELVRIEYA